RIELGSAALRVLAQCAIRMFAQVLCFHQQPMACQLLFPCLWPVSKPDKENAIMGSVAMNGPWTMNISAVGFQNSLPFSNLEGEALARFKAIAPEISRSRGESLFTEGQNPKCVFIVRSGRVKLTVSSREGKTAILRIAGPGEILGLSAAMSSAPHETSAEAVE